MQLNLKAALIREKESQPHPDIGTCSECGWCGLLADCDTEQDGDWEHGYFEVPLCPDCDSGGCIDDFDYSPEEYIKWVQWNHNQIKGGGDMEWSDLDKGFALADPTDK